MKTLTKLLVFTLFLFAPFCIAAKKTDLNKLVAPYSLKFKSNSFKVEKSQLRVGPTKKFHSISAVDKQRALRLEMEITTPIKPKSANRYIKTKYMVMKNMYEDQPTPYKGEITNTSSCPPNKKAKFKQLNFFNNSKRVLLGAVSSRNSFGVCQKSEIAKNGLFIIAHNPDNSTLYQMKLFYPLNYPTKSILKLISEATK